MKDEAELLDELSRVNNELVNAKRELARRNAELERLAARMRMMVITDALTAFYNRRGFFEYGEREVQRGRRTGAEAAVIACDLDDFKAINDRHGHRAGDLVLETVTARWHAQLRAVDVAARFGGDEFAILLPDTDLAGARRVARRLRLAAGREPVDVGDALVDVTASFGIAAGDLTSFDDLDGLMRRADEALYRAKAAGRNAVSD